MTTYDIVNPSRKLIERFRINFIIIPLLAIITVSAGSYFAQTGNAWYKSLTLPPWTPGGIVFVLVWTIIFFLSTLCLLITWNKYSTTKNFSFIVALFLLNGLLNVGWNVIFFVHHEIALSLFVAVLLTLDVLSLMLYIRKFSPFTSYLLYPYFLWVIFASFLTLNVWILN